MEDWAFDVEDTLLAEFQEHQLMLAGIAGLTDVVTWKLKEIQRNPHMAGSVRAVDGDVVYLAQTGRYRSGVPPLLIVYLLDIRQRIIRPFLLCKEDEDDDVDDRIRRALRRRKKPGEH
jgi:hypothetical protein